jgi:trehalose/maltose hydrolase-like predicted phosphorylase
MINHDHWSISSQTFEPARQNHEETIFTIGNGYLSTRGTFEEGYPGESHTTFVAGVFDDIPIVFTELANLPNWVSLDILIEGERFSMKDGQVLAFERKLDLHSGVLSRSVRWQSPKGKTVDFNFQRFASLANVHLLCLQVSVTPVNFSGTVEVHSDLNGNEATMGMLHLSWLDQGVDENSAWLSVRTNASKMNLAMAMRLHVEGGRAVKQVGWDIKNHPTLAASWQAVPGETVTFEKIVTVFNSRDGADPLQAAQDALKQQPQPAWGAAAFEHVTAWEKEWEISDVVIEGDDLAQNSLRFNIYQLLIAAPRHDEHVSIGAKTLSGYGYRGHSFWDTEIFMLPFFTYTRPDIARNLLSYRYHNLAGARKKAKANGYSGAQFPWESAADGEEVTPTWVPSQTDRSQLIRIWTGDIEIHVSSDIVYALWRYWQMTGDDAFLCERGAEIILETARFWATRAEWNADAQRYEFNNVIGPDENHDRINNNAYTNCFARWNLLTAIKLVDWLQSNYPAQWNEVAAKIQLDLNELVTWKKVADQIYIPYQAETRMMEQFEGYFKCTDLDLEDYKDRTISMQALLGIDEACATQILKQPDVLMLFYLLPEDYDMETVRINYDYYTPRTDHTYGSSLGPAIQSIMACKVGDIADAYEHFLRAAKADLYDVRGNAGDGIHGASAGGLWQAVVFGFSGLNVTTDGWKVEPHLPKGWKRVAFKFYLHGKLHEVEVKG